MSMAALAVIYVAMLVFDAAMVAGGVYLVVERGQSAWWLVLALVMVLGSNPRALIRAVGAMQCTQ